MAAKSTNERYGSVGISIHWMSAILILALVGSGFRAAQMADSAMKADMLRFHIPVAIVVVALTAARILWWSFFDQKPEPVPGMPRWQDRLARAVHIAFYIVILGMTASGIYMIALSDAGPIIFGDMASKLPDFSAYPPRTAHGVGGWLLVALFVAHAGAAVHHQFVRRDGLLRRMWPSRTA